MHKVLQRTGVFDLGSRTASARARRRRPSGALSIVHLAKPANSALLDSLQNGLARAGSSLRRLLAGAPIARALLRDVMDLWPECDVRTPVCVGLRGSPGNGRDRPRGVAQSRRGRGCSSVGGRTRPPQRRRCGRPLYGASACVPRSALCKLSSTATNLVCIKCRQSVGDDGRAQVPPTPHRFTPVPLLKSAAISLSHSSLIHYELVVEPHAAGPCRHWPGRREQ